MAIKNFASHSFAASSLENSGLTSTRSEENTGPFHQLKNQLINPLTLDLGPTKKVNLEELKTYSSRSTDRTPAVGKIIVYDSCGKILAKAHLRNLSRGGLGIEVGAVALPTQMLVHVDFSHSTPNMGLVRCRVHWVSKIEGLSEIRKNVGLSFDDLNPTANKVLESYFADLKKFSSHVK